MASITTKKSKINKFSVLAILFLIVGTALLAYSIKEIIVYNHKSNYYVKTEAQVIKHNYVNGKVSSVILEYVIDEYKYTINSTDSLDCIKSYGSTVSIKYNPNNPEEIIFSNRSINILVPVASLVLIAIGLVIAIVKLTENVRRIKRLSKIIINKTNQDDISNINAGGLTEVVNKTYHHEEINNVEIPVAEPNINPQIIETPKEEVTVQVPHQEFIKEQDNFEEELNTGKEIVELPFVSQSESKNNDVDFIHFIAEQSDFDEAPNFIPNIDELKR